MPETPVRESTQTPKTSPSPPPPRPPAPKVGRPTPAPWSNRPPATDDMEARSGEQGIGPEPGAPIRLDLRLHG